MLQENSLIVSLSISKWTARKHDKKITKEVKEQHNASDDAGRYNKSLAAKKDLEAIALIESKARTYHYKNTLPWGENNERLLASAIFMDYLAEMNRIEAEYKQAVHEFCEYRYDSVVLEARVRLNGMFDERDYPSREAIKEKFKFGVKFMPVTEVDFRVKLQDEEVARLKESVGVEINNRLADAVKDIWTRIKDQLVHMRDRLSDKDAIFRDSLFDNLKELITLLPRLNVTNDPAIQDVCNQMVKVLADPGAVRTNSNLRNEKAEEVQNILNNFNNFFPQ